jgi:pyruvate/2-oxoglutarate dehydrogenase complex dihydrolipoamide acyltransferase (E2) component
MSGIVPIRIPKLAMTTEQATLTEWLIPDGVRAVEGTALYVMETDKVETEIDAAATGVVHWKATLLETYPVGTEIGEIIVDE